MPQTTLLFYREQDGQVPLREWLAAMPNKVSKRCVAMLKLLEQHGHELRRPYADIIASTGLHELRTKLGRVNYRMLYFFHGQNVVVLSHGFTKENKIPAAEIKIAQQRKTLFEANPELHTLR